MEQENGVRFILVKMNGGSELINASHIRRIEKINEIVRLHLTEGTKLLVNHTFEEMIDMLPNVINKGSINNM